MRPIDADALVLELCKWNNKPYPSSFNHDFIVKGVLRDFLVCIAEAPTLDHAPVVHGEWDCGDVYVWRCTLCKKWLMVEDQDGEMNFCPNCGANMDGGKEHDAP